MNKYIKIAFVLFLFNSCFIDKKIIQINDTLLTVIPFDAALEKQFLAKNRF